MKTKTRLIKKKSYSPEEQLKLFRQFASWSKKRKLAYLKKCPAMQVLEYKETWRAWARDDQLAPAGLWSTWVVKAGRGWGKTRTGAEWVIEKARAYPGCHIALVGRTTADVRKVMVMGISGILACSPHDFIPEYNPSLRQLTWPNGSKATTYSAEEPDQLRGPQHSFAWADERCFVAGTLIRTSKGLLPIEEIRPGDLVYTRGGLKRVRHAGLTNPSTTVYDLTTSNGRVLTGTGNHPIWVQDKGFKPLHSLSSGDILMSWDQLKLNTVSSGMGVGGGSIKGIIATEEESCYTELSMHPYMDQSPPEWISTTKTKTKPITISQILKCSQDLNIRSATGRVVGPFGTTKKDSSQHGSNGRVKSHTQLSVLSVAKNSLPQVRGQSSVIRTVEQPIGERTQRKFPQLPVISAVDRSWPTKRECATALLNVHIQLENSLNHRGSVLPAKKALMHMIQEQCAALVSVEPFIKIGTMPQKREYAFTAKPPSQLTSPRQKQSSAQEHVGTCTEAKNSITKVLRVEQRSEKMAVFNMEVEDCHEYFANDVLVHNCAWQYDDAWDQLSFGLRIAPAPGVEPQCCVTTTPRNTKAIKALLADPSTVVTNGRTYDNKENLSPRFIREIERRYAGTRLGLQEINGEVVDDIEGALWKRKWIDDGRVVKRCELKRVVVAVDPPGSSSTEGDAPPECGIVVAGLGVDGRGYVLADCSLTGTPNEWAEAVLAAFSLFEADCVVGETNFGGEMVETVIKLAAEKNGLKHVPFKAVRASRGKQVRAEPISNLYQKESVSHVGVLPDLEDQLCNWTPGQKSPDRLDACVWALTELMISPDPTAEDHIKALEQRMGKAA